MFVGEGAHRDQKMALDSLGLELQTVVSHPTHVLGSNSGPLQEWLLTEEPSLQPCEVISSDILLFCLPSLNHDLLPDSDSCVT